MAGDNFGCGSSRPAARNLVRLGISCVLAESFNGLFFRNGICSGLPLVECRGVQQAIEEGDECYVSLDSRTVTNLTRNTTLEFERLPDNILEVLQAGGLTAYLRNELRKNTRF